MMRLDLCGAACVIALMLGFSTVRCTPDKNADDEQTRDEQTRADLTQFRSYLEENAPGKKWQTGPAHIDSEEIRKAYEKLRFYYVFSSPPTPPGAALLELIEEYQQKLDLYQKEFISLAMSIDEQGNMAPLHKAEDYSLGLMRVTTDADAKIAAAAVLSLYYSDLVGPGIVAAKEVALTRSEKGWTCSVLRENAFQGEVYFDGDGKLVSVTKTSAGSPPP